MIRVLLCLLALSAITPCALADWQLRSWSRWEITPGGAEAIVSVEKIELQRLSIPDNAAWFEGEIRRTVHFMSADAKCELMGVEPQASLPSLLRMRVGFRCPGALESPSVRVSLFAERASRPLHYASIRYQGQVSEALLAHGSDTVALRERGDTPGALSVIRQYTLLGLVHILEGLDHIAFLLCLLLAAPGLARRAWMVTGFTLGHSATLSLSALDLLRVQTAGVEALIGFTVALLAAETWQRRNGGHTATWLLCAVSAALLGAALVGADLRLPAASAFALLLLAPAYLRLAAQTTSARALHLGMVVVFGLVHGLGFASALRSIGLPEGQRGWALAGFNIGVEIGQLLLLLFFAGIIALLGRITGTRYAGACVTALSALLCATGLFWLVQRAV